MNRRRLARLLRYLAAFISPCVDHVPTWHTRPVYCGLCFTLIPDPMSSDADDD